jgi:hypothetical protein
MLNRSGVQNAFNHNVKIGNWSEDQELHELRMKEYLSRKATGSLLVQAVQNHMAKSLAEVELTQSPDGLLRIGDSIMLYSVNTEGVLSVDMSDRIASSDEGYTVTTCTHTPAHVARNVFVIDGYGAGYDIGDVLKLGQPFRLRVNPALAAAPTYLHSQPISMTSASKVSRKQEVAAVRATGFDTVFIAQFKNHDLRFEMEGQPVPANAEIIISHAATRQCLSSSPLGVINDFGKEFEVCAHTAVGTGKKQTLYNEQLGTTTSDIQQKGEQTKNWWAFLTAAPAE